MSGWNNKYNKDKPFHFKVPYSSHSNHRELERFVAAIRPENLVFHVSDRENCASRFKFQDYLMKKYSNFLSSSKEKSKFLVPKVEESCESAAESECQANLDLGQRFDHDNKAANTTKFFFQNSYILKKKLSYLQRQE